MALVGLIIYMLNQVGVIINRKAAQQPKREMGIQGIHRRPLITYNHILPITGILYDEVAHF